MADVALITLTSDRPLAFQLCERWMARAIAQFGQPVRWYVVDDGLEPVHCTLGQVHIRCPAVRSTTESFLNNLSAALRVVNEEKILFIEDDDCYAANYIMAYAEWLDQAEIVGEGCAKFYCVTNRKYLILNNAEHASLCQTGIRRGLVDWFAQLVVKSSTPYVDDPLWLLGGANRIQNLKVESRLCIGMKGLPGKRGIGACHDGSTHWQAIDQSGEVLRSWIGCDDAGVYLELSKPHDLPQIAEHDLAVNN